MNELTLNVISVKVKTEFSLGSMLILHTNPQLLKWNVNIIFGCTEVWCVCMSVCLIYFKSI